MDTVVEQKKKTTRGRKSSKPAYSKEMYLNWYEMMLRIRKFEERALLMYGQQKIRGFCHVYIGQEAVAAGIESAIRPEDGIVTAYRQHGTAIGRGLETKVCMAELFGKKTGAVKGKGGSMHFFSADHRYFGGNGIVGAQIAMGAGVGFAEKYNETGNVVCVSMGDGAVRQGALHETFNMAMNWKLPVIFIIENNNYAMGTSVERTTNVTDLSKIGASYEMPSRSVNGMSPEAVHEAIEEAADRARKGDGPTLLDIRTYRYKGHSMSDPQKYRTKDEVAEWMDQDPIQHCLDIIKENKWLKEKEIEEIDAWVKNEVKESVEFADGSPYPEGKELYEDVYKEDNYPFIIEY